jgi:hypothetical protein
MSKPTRSNRSHTGDTAIEHRPLAYSQSSFSLFEFLKEERNTIVSEDTAITPNEMRAAESSNHNGEEA